MIKLIVGGKGSGKTKKMIEMINDSAATTPGNIVCIEKSMKPVSYTHLDVYKRQALTCGQICSNSSSRTKPDRYFVFRVTDIIYCPQLSLF